MLTIKHRTKLLAFLVIAAVSVVYAGVNYAGLDRLFGAGGYTVTAQLDSSGGIFVGAEVTYRGVAVGEVTSMRLDAEGVALGLHITSEAPPIPAGASAAVANRSAIGEQYVDLRPDAEAEPYLADGSVIPNERTSIPVDPATVLLNLDQLVSSVNRESLRTVVDETYQAFAGVGPDLQALLDTAGSFVATATENLPETTGLLADARVVLDTQRAQAGNIKAIADGMATIAEQLKSSDGDLRRVIDKAPGLSREVRSFLAESGNDLGILTANLLTTAHITTSRVDGIEQLLVTFPVISAFSHTLSGDGTGHLGVAMNFFNPPSCTRGYEGTVQRPASDTSPYPVNMGAYCAEPPGDPTGVRGAQNAPYAGKPMRVPPPSQVRGGQEKPAKQQDATPEMPGVLRLSTGGGPLPSVGELLGLPGQ